MHAKVYTAWLAQQPHMQYCPHCLCCITQKVHVCCVAGELTGLLKQLGYTQEQVYKF